MGKANKLESELFIAYIRSIVDLVERPYVVSCLALCVT